MTNFNRKKAQLIEHSKINRGSRGLIILPSFLHGKNNRSMCSVGTHYKPFKAESLFKNARWESLAEACL